MTAALECGEWSAARSGRTLPPGKTRYPFYRRLGGSQGRSGRAENLVSTGIRSRTVQPVAKSLYRLSYRAHNNISYYVLVLMHFVLHWEHNWGLFLNSSPGLEFELGLPCWKDPVGSNRFFSSQKRPNRLWVQPSLLFNGSSVFIPRGKAARAWS